MSRLPSDIAPRIKIEALRPVLGANHIAEANLIAGDIDAAAVDGNVAVANHLPGLGPTLAEAEPMHDVIQAAFEQDHERIARVALAL